MISVEGGVMVKDTEKLLQKFIDELPIGTELEKKSVDNEIDFKVRREELFEILKPYGLDILNSEETSPEKIEEIKKQIVEKLQSK